MTWDQKKNRTKQNKTKTRQNAFMELNVRQELMSNYSNLL